MADNVAITAGTGTTVATDEVGGVHYQRVKLAHGADGAATDVSAASPMPIGGAAADDAAAAGNPVPIGGMYQDAVDEVDAGDVGRVRITKRRALMGAADCSYVELSESVLTAEDITGPASGAYTIRDTDMKVWVIPVRVAGWRHVHISFTTNTAFDQALTVQMLCEWKSIIGSFILPASSIYRVCVTPGATGQGGAVGGATASVFSHYSMPAMSDAMMLYILIQASVAPSVGTLTVNIGRSS